MARSRRAVLRTIPATPILTALSGCSGGDSPAEANTPSTASASPTHTPGASDTATPSAMDLDLREANVVGVSVESREGDYRFDVTLHHDDAGESGYANWWQVEGLDGTRLGRRDLLHAHDQQPFTRSATVEIPEEVTCVVVRGHDQTHGYGGRAMVIDVGTGATTPVDQGADRRHVDASDCP